MFIIGGLSPQMCLLWVLRVRRAATQTPVQTASQPGQMLGVCHQSEISNK